MGEQTLQIAVGKSHVAQIDAEDYDRVSAVKWFRNSRGYAVGKVVMPDGERRLVLMHRYILTFPSGTIDHRNRDLLDNRRQNLRLCTQAQNSCNRPKRSGAHSSSFKGVSLRKHATKDPWVASIQIPDGERLHLGCFAHEIAAAIAYDAAAYHLHGAFARLNFNELSHRVA